MANPAPTINQINAFNATQGTTVDFNIIGGTELVRSNRIYIYDLSDNSLICTHLYVSTESIHELPPNTDSSIVYESGKSSADFVNGAQYYAQIQTFTDIGGTVGGSGLSVAKMFWCLGDPTLTIDTIPSTISTTSYNVSATYDANTSVVSNIIQQYQFSLYSATGSLLQSSGVVVGNGEQQGTSTAYDISYNFTGLSVGSSYYVTVEVTTTQGMSVSVQSSTFTVSIDTPTLGEATVVNNACDGYISVTSNLSSEYGGSGSGDIVSFETDSENVFTKLQVSIEPTQSGSGTPSPSNVRHIYGVGGVEVNNTGVNIWDEEWRNGYYNSSTGAYSSNANMIANANPVRVLPSTVYYLQSGTYNIGVSFYDAEMNFISQTAAVRNTTFTTPSNCYYINFSNSWNSGGTYNNDISINYPSTDHDYHEYDGQTVSQDFDVSLTSTSKDTDPYLFKAVGDVYGDRLEEELVGGSVVWNQHAKEINSSNYAPEASHVTATISDGEYTFKSDTVAYGVYHKSFMSNSVVTNKVFIVTARIKATTNAKARILVGGNYGSARDVDVTTSYQEVNAILKTESRTTRGFYILAGPNATNIDFTVNFQKITDLTAFFANDPSIADAIYAMEQATAGSGVAFMRKYFPTLFSADYDTGTLKSVNPTAHKMVGFNQLPYIPTYKDNAGIRDVQFSGDCVRLIEGKQYEFNFENISNATNWRIAYISFDLNGSRLSHNVFTNVTTSTSSSFSWYDYQKAFLEGGNGTTKWVRFTANEDCYIYLTFGVGNATSSSIMSKPCLHFNDANLNGKYFPYEEHSYDLGNVPLYGLFQLENNKLKAYGDVRHAVGGTDRKFGVVILNGSEPNWNKSGSALNGYYVNMVSGTWLPNGYMKEYGRVVAVGYEWTNDITTYYNNYGYCYTDYTIGFNVDPSKCGSTLEEFKAWLAQNPITVVYELATPTTETTTPFTQIQEVSKYGTLEYITSNDVPVGHNTTYYTRDVFGGYIDLVSGRLVVTHKTILLDGTEDLWTEYPSYETQICYLRDVFEGAIPKKILQPNWGISNYMQCVTNILSGTITAGQMSNSTANSRKNLYMTYVSGITTLSAWKTYLATHPLQLCYELATPLTYQLTPQQIQTLVGTNNVWSEQGDIELVYHIPITNLLVKRQDVDDVSGNWLTLYSQPITQASDMDFTFIDFLNQYGKTYKYALVPLLTQTQSGVEVEVEGGYTVSDEVQSIFDGVFISDSTGSQKCKANVGYGNVNMNQSVGSITPIGSQYPIIVTNSNNRYHNGSISGMIVPDDYYYNGNLSRIDMVNKRNELEQFLTNKRAKIIKDWNSNIWLVMIMDNIDCSFDNNYGMGIVTFNANWLEVGDPTNQEDLQATGLVDVGGV